MVKMPHWPVPYGSKDMKFGLERMHALLHKLNNPHLKLTNVIHVAGTNGKGSTIAYLKAIFEEIGYTVNTYTSPHIYRYNERIVLAGKEITDDYLYQICEEVRIAAQDLQTTFFEATTVAAFLAMSSVKSMAPIINLVEVGLGGRLDATNVFENPLLSVITPIDYDHVEFLGNTLSKIASEKAAILKPGCPGVVSWQFDEAYNQIEQYAKNVDSPLFACGKFWNFMVLPNNNFVYEDNNVRLELPKPSLAGQHQYINAATSVAALRAIRNLLPSDSVLPSILASALTKAKWPARMEHVTSGKIAKMLPKGYELWVDGAHNVGGARMAALTVSQMPDMPTILVNGRTINRDIKGFLECFGDVVNEIYAVNVHSEPKCEKASVIGDCAKNLGFTTFVENSVTDAIKNIVRRHNKPHRILVCGSLYLAADILQANREFAES